MTAPPMDQTDSNQLLIVQNANLISAKVSDDTLIMNVETGKFIQINRSAAIIWEMIETPMTFASLCAALVERFDVSAETCEAEVRDWIEHMRALRLIELRHS